MGLPKGTYDTPKADKVKKPKEVVFPKRGSNKGLYTSVPVEDTLAGQVSKEITDFLVRKNFRDGGR